MDKITIAAAGQRVEAYAVDGGETEFVVYNEAGEPTATVRLPAFEASVMLAALEVTRNG